MIALVVLLNRFDLKHSEQRDAFKHCQSGRQREIHEKPIHRETRFVERLNANEAKDTGFNHLFSCHDSKVDFNPGCGLASPEEIISPPKKYCAWAPKPGSAGPPSTLTDNSLSQGLLFRTHESQ